ncbi:Arylsulfatase [Planctomycetales bacterium 10988]|nr:Arylsulfatase [Planctomycetales bacterium 10988]
MMLDRNFRKSLAFLTTVLLFTFSGSSFSHAAEETSSEQPNILWLYLEDVSGWFGCYGDELAQTPAMDRLAESGIKFNRFYTPAGVCSATRSAVITGVMQTTIGAHNHRSSRSEFRGLDLKEYDAIYLPEGMKPIPQIFKEAGYYTFNEGGVKDDFNFVWKHKDLYDHWEKSLNFKGAKDGTEWTGKAEGQPFFGQIQIQGGKFKLNNWKHQRIDRSIVPIPPYYPDIPLVREEIGHHYDCLYETDLQVKAILEALQRDDLLENTYIFLFSDHGYRMHRHKQFLYEGGIQMPFILTGPTIDAGKVRDDLISGIDLGPTSLNLAGIEIPDYCEGVDILAKNYEPREFIVAARDRCDHTIEQMRALVTKRFKYLRNGLLDRPYMQPQYRDGLAVTKQIRKMARDGELNKVQMLFYGDHKPEEELYDLEADPHEINNLAGDPAYADELEKHRELLDQWIEETGDKGQEPESDAGLLATMKRRGGNVCVNPEYDRVRDQYEAWLKENPKELKRQNR